jgi:hypothetical protein
MSDWLLATMALTGATLKGIVRSKIFIGLFAVGVCIVGLALMLAELAVGEMVTSLIDLGLALTTLAVSALCILNICTNPASNSNPRQAIVLVARPVDRSVVVVSRFVAVTSLGVASSLALGGLLSAIVLSFGGPGLRCFAAAAAASLEVLVVSSLALVCWTRMGAVTATTLSFALFAVGRLDGVATHLIDRGTFGAATPLAKVIAHMMPHLSLFDLTAWVHDGPPKALAFAALYAGLYSTAMVLVAIALYRRHEFT